MCLAFLSEKTIFPQAIKTSDAENRRCGRNLLMIDLSSYPVVDSHCHPFLPNKEIFPKGAKGEFTELFSLSSFHIPKLHRENVVFFRKAMKELARILDCPFDFDEITKRRKARYAKPKEYISKLFEEAKIDTLIVDTGFPGEENGEHSVPFEEFKKLVKCKLQRIYRLEPLFSKLYKRSLSFDEMFRNYIESLHSAVKLDGYVAFKSVIAYYFGLKIHKVDEEDARGAYERLRGKKKLLAVSLTEKDPKALADKKLLHDFLVCWGIEKSIELDVPFQIHTGIGSSSIDARYSNPLHLYEVIRDKKLGKAKIVLVHAGYPYVEEAGFLASSFPNIYVDVSQMMPFIGTGIKDKVLQLLYMSPITKIMYGSDGYNIPELFWISAIWGKKAISEAFQELVKSEAFDEDYAYKAGSLILSKNAVRLYKL
jgi:predicted TIM-barrel fold metal-dependent hydrolase